MDIHAAHMFTEAEVEEMLGPRMRKVAHETDQLPAQLADKENLI